MPYEQRVVGAGYVDAHNAVRAALGLTAVAHPANLFPSANSPEILDAPGDQLGTTAQDIISCDLAYNSASQQIVYTLTLADLSGRTANNQWTISSNFGAVTVFVSAAISETGAPTYEYGKITTLASGTRNQETIGPVDSGEISGNQIIMKVALSKVNAAVGSNVLGTTSTAVGAQAQILIGTSATGGLLLNSDSASGTDFKVEESGTGGSGGTGGTGGGGTTPQASEFTERLMGTLAPGQASVEVPVKMALPSLDALINYNPANEALKLELIDGNGNVVAVGDQSSNKRITRSGLAVGSYKYRVSGSPTKTVDFVIKSHQLNTAQ
jgi:hypothetical protein